MYCSSRVTLVSDSSEYAYGSAAYTKIYAINGIQVSAGESNVNFKTRAYCRSTFSKTYKLVLRELEFKIESKYFWTDSMIVLGYMKNENKRFKTFVANRLTLIHDVTSPKDWRYVPTKLNPADLASRGLQPYEGDRQA